MTFLPSNVVFGHPLRRGHGGTNQNAENNPMQSSTAAARKRASDARVPEKR
ncbi:hypothetical protein Q3C01_37195 [Bradyrhizobium sp. UFLA05-109]